MDKRNTIYFDLDGTLYDLYGQPRWLERITVDYDATAYDADAPLVNLDDLHAVLDALISQGYSVGVISWCAGGSTREYDSAVRKIKRAWVKRFLPQATEIHIVKYGTPKHRVASDPQGILIDDNAEILATWKGQKVNATEMLDTLRGLVN